MRGVPRQMTGVRQQLGGALGGVTPQMMGVLSQLGGVTPHAIAGPEALV